MVNRESQAWRPNIASDGIQADAPSVVEGGGQIEGSQMFDNDAVIEPFTKT